MLQRREFLRHLTAAATALALDPFRGIEISARNYSNARLGLSVTLPDGWEFSSIADFVALRERQVLHDVLEVTRTEPHPLKDLENLPVFLFEEPGQREGHFVPAIILYDEDWEGPVPGDQPAKHAELLVGLGRSYRDLAVIEHPRVIDLHDVVASCSRCSYLHEVDSGEGYMLDIRTVLVWREPSVHTYYLADLAESPRITPDVWQRFIDSVTYT